MGDQEYTPQEALSLLMRKLRERDNGLAARIQAVVDAGKDVEETEPSSGRRKKNARLYRKTVPYTYEEALIVAINALTAYFIEQPLFVDSFLDNMAHAALGAKHNRYYWETERKKPVGIIPKTEENEKIVQIEIRTETQISQPEQDTQQLTRVSARQIHEQQANVARLRDLIEFDSR